MSDDPAIRIFGRAIAVQESAAGLRLCPGADPTADARGCEKDIVEVIHMEVEDPCASNPHRMDDIEVTSSLSSDMQTQSLDEKQTPDNKSAPKQADVGVSSQEKVNKKPDKILPCPRCNSMDTKFCYYNNYNVNQPRHFCKSCQRYWTAGGTMRNVPVGAGRRKSKHSASNHRQLLISTCAAPLVGGDVPDSTCKQVLPSGASISPMNGNGTGRPCNDEICDSVGKIISPEEQKRKGDMALKSHTENGEDAKCTNVNTSNSNEDNISELATQVLPNISLPPCNGLAPVHPLQCVPGPPWAYPWNPGWNNFAAMAATASGRCSFELVHGQENGSLHSFPWNPPIVAAPAFCTTPVPLPFIPPPFWGCMPNWSGGAWAMPWVGSPGSLPTSTSNGNCVSSGNSSPLGKHSRDLTTGMEEKKEKSVWVPKTLRIDDPDEAAKSSIWATLGIKPGKYEQSTSGGIFKGFQSQSGGENNHQPDASQVLHANPAAFCRSQTFQETS